MIKTILWFCNRPIEITSDRRDGTWFTAMARSLAASGKVKLAIISQAKVDRLEKYGSGDIAQWVVPFETLSRVGLPTRKTIEAIQGVFDEIKPDLVHVWGTENYWGLLSARGRFSCPTVLEIQGLKYACAKVFYGDLAMSELLRCVGPLEILRPSSSLFMGKRRFERWGRFEKEMILKHKYISTQSDWVRSHMLSINSASTLFNTGIMLRQEFLESHAWSSQKHQTTSSPSLFTSSSGAAAYKGLHVLLRAIALLKEKYPRIVLNVAGDIMKNGIRQSGYSRWLHRESHRLGVFDNICWLGPLDAEGIICNSLKVSAVVIPSFVETYSLAMAEAMVIGVPVVASSAGAMPELACNGLSALFFPSGDEVACASQIEKVIDDKVLANKLSQNSRQTGLTRNSPHEVVKRQISIYNEILAIEFSH